MGKGGWVGSELQIQNFGFKKRLFFAWFFFSAKSLESLWKGPQRSLRASETFWGFLSPNQPGIAPRIQRG